MQNNSSLQAKKWIEKANDDELSIKAILRDECGAPSTACFLSQQMAEKYLKAFLVASKQEFPKIHQLDRLLELCMEINDNFIELKDETLLLNDYYTETRYPADYPVFNMDEARQAFESAIKIKDFVLGKV